MTLIVSLFAILLLVSTNPGDADHKAAIEAQFNVHMQEAIKRQTTSKEADLLSMGVGLGIMSGGFFADKMVDASVSCANYPLLPTTNFTSDKKSITIGFGVLGNVFLSPNVDDAVKDASERIGK